MRFYIRYSEGEFRKYNWNADLISIQSNSENEFEDVLKRLRAKSVSAPSLEEITKEVEAVRSARYVK